MVPGTLGDPKRKLEKDTIKAAPSKQLWHRLALDPLPRLLLLGRPIAAQLPIGIHLRVSRKEPARRGELELTPWTSFTFGCLLF